MQIKLSAVDKTDRNLLPAPLILPSLVNGDPLSAAVAYNSLKQRVLKHERAREISGSTKALPLQCSHT